MAKQQGPPDPRPRAALSRVFPRHQKSVVCCRSAGEFAFHGKFFEGCVELIAEKSGKVIRATILVE
jgi:hypothetical protein